MLTSSVCRQCCIRTAYNGCDMKDEDILWGHHRSMQLKASCSRGRGLSGGGSLSGGGGLTGEGV